MAKDLGQELENMEEAVENLKNKEFRILGFKVTFMSISALAAVIGTVIGGLYFGFTMYQKIEEVAGLDVGAFEQRMEVIETQLDEALGYARDIKNDLRGDILGIEKSVDRIEDKVDALEEDVRDMIQNAETRFENKRDALQNDYDEGASRLQDRSDSRLTDLEDKMERAMRELEDNLNARLQRALDNPLAN